MNNPKQRYTNKNLSWWATDRERDHPQMEWVLFIPIGDRRGRQTTPSRWQHCKGVSCYWEWSK